MLPKTIYNEAKFVKSLPAKYDGFFDWEFLNPLFPNKIEVTDIDGIVERKGNFLIFETKALMAMIPRGQMIMHEKMIMTGLFTVIHIWGDNAEEWKIYYPLENLSSNIVSEEGQGKESLISKVKEWVAFVEQ